MKRACSIVVFLLIVLAMVGCSHDPTGPADVTAPAVGDKSADYGVEIIPPTATPLGRTYAEWSAEWWRWMWSAPADVNPGLDPTGEFASWMQTGPVWFLAPAFYGQWERHVTIPNGTMVFIDLAGYFVSYAQGDGATEAELRAAATQFIDGVVSNVVLEVDGVRLQHVEDFRFASPPGLIDYSVPDDNVFQAFGYDIPAGDYQDATAEGYYAMLPPLCPGHHTIFLSAEFGAPFDDTIQVTYDVTVTRGRSQARRTR